MTNYIIAALAALGLGAAFRARKNTTPRSPGTSGNTGSGSTYTPTPSASPPPESGNIVIPVQGTGGVEYTGWTNQGRPPTPCPLTGAPITDDPAPVGIPGGELETGAPYVAPDAATINERITSTIGYTPGVIISASSDPGYIYAQGINLAQRDTLQRIFRLPIDIPRDVYNPVTGKFAPARVLMLSLNNKIWYLRPDGGIWSAPSGGIKANELDILTTAQLTDRKMTLERKLVETENNLMAIERETLPEELANAERVVDYGSLDVPSDFVPEFSARGQKESAAARKTAKIQAHENITMPDAAISAWYSDKDQRIKAAKVGLVKIKAELADVKKRIKSAMG